MKNKLCPFFTVLPSTNCFAGLLQKRFLKSFSFHNSCHKQITFLFFQRGIRPVIILLCILQLSLTNLASSQQMDHAKNTAELIDSNNKNIFINVFARGCALTDINTSGFNCRLTENKYTKAVKPRILILTDISSLTQGYNEPDDGQSLVRLLLYANEFDIEGIIAASNLGHGQTTRPDLIRQVVDAYGKVLPNLLINSKGYPTEKALNNIIKNGQPLAGPDTPVFNSIGEGKDTEASEWIIHVADKKDERPLWITVWGGTADLAQALWKVRQTRTLSELKIFISKLKIDAISGQDATAKWIKSEFPSLFYITRRNRGMYRGGDVSLVDSLWVEKNIRNNHGALGAMYVNYRGGDIFRLPVKGIKEGDTPSFLGKVLNGLNHPDYPEWGSWGGRLQKIPGSINQYEDAVDAFGNYLHDFQKQMATIYRWRSDYQADFQARLDWCVKSFGQVNHQPVNSRKDVVKLKIKPGQKIKLRAKGWTDPDKNILHYSWMIYPEEGTCLKSGSVKNENSDEAFFTAPEIKSSCTVHIILKVADDGEPSLHAYQRYIISIKP